MSLTASPIRFPDPSSRPLMTRRGWWLVGLNVLIPGSAQVLAGNRRLGRFGLGATLVLWTLLAAALVVWWLWPTVLYTLMSNSLALWGFAALFLFYAVVWVVLTLDTLRLVRLVKTAPLARPAIAVLGLAIMVALSGSAAYGAYVATTASGFLSSVFVAGPSEPPVDGKYNFLLLGGDAGPDREGLRPDSISVVSVDSETGQAVTIGLPRDLERVPFPDDSPMHASYPDGYGTNGCDVSVCMLNSIYTEVELKSPEMYPDAAAEGSSPGIEAMRDAAEGITGLSIQYYVLIDMQGFSDLIDALGGVEIEVTERQPIGGDENLDFVEGWIEPGVQVMDGYTALWYARSRHASSDYDRMQRQRQLQEAILRQFTPVNVLTKFQDIATAGSQGRRTEHPPSIVGYFADLAMKTRELPILDIELIPENGIEPQDPDYAYIRSLIDEGLAAAATATPVPAEGE